MLTGYMLRPLTSMTRTAFWKLLPWEACSRLGKVIIRSFCSQLANRKHIATANRSRSWDWPAMWKGDPSENGWLSRRKSILDAQWKTVSQEDVQSMLPQLDLCHKLKTEEKTWCSFVPNIIEAQRRRLLLKEVWKGISWSRIQSDLTDAQGLREDVLGPPSVPASRYYLSLIFNHSPLMDWEIVISGSPAKLLRTCLLQLTSPSISNQTSYLWSNSRIDFDRISVHQRTSHVRLWRRGGVRWFSSHFCRKCRNDRTPCRFIIVKWSKKREPSF